MHMQITVNIHNDHMFMHARGHTSVPYHATSTRRQSRRLNVTEGNVSPPSCVTRLSRSHSHDVTARDVSPPAGVTRLSQSHSWSVTDRAVSPPAGVNRLTGSRSLTSAERQCDSQRDMILLQHKLNNALQKLDSMKQALAAKVSTNICQSHDIYSRERY